MIPNQQPTITQTPSNPECFHQIGTDIRNRLQPDLAFLWQDTPLPDQVMTWVGQSGTAQGRVGAILSHNQQIGFIGWYECDPDERLHQSLLCQAENWLKEQGCKQVIGPINGSSWFSYRFNLSQEIPLFPGEPFQPAHYPVFWELSGYQHEVLYHSSTIDLAEAEVISEDELRSFFHKKDLQVEYLTPALYHKKRELIFQMLHVCFSINPVFQAINLETFGAIYDDMPAKLPEGFALLVSNADGLPQGIYIAYPDGYSSLYQQHAEVATFLKQPKIILKTIATHPTWQNQLFGTQIVKYFHGLGQRFKLPYAIHAMMYMKNISFLTSERKFASQRERTYALMQKNL